MATDLNICKSFFLTLCLPVITETRAEGSVHQAKHLYAAKLPAPLLSVAWGGTSEAGEAPGVGSNAGILLQKEEQPLKEPKTS